MVLVKIKNRAKLWTWQHVCSQDTPADMSTRGISPSGHGNPKLYWEEPTWPRSRELPVEWDKAGKDEQEVATLANQALPSPNIRHVMDITRFNCLEKLLVITAKVQTVMTQS